MALGSIMDIFRSKPEAPAPVVDPSKQNQLVPGNATAKSDGSVPAIPKAAEGDASPLDKYKDIWQLDPKAAKPATPAELAIPITTDPAKMLAAARGVDFLKGISAENLDKALKGDGAALLAIVNEATQNAYAQSATATTRLISAALEKQATVFQDKVMPELLRRHEISQATAADNPVLQSDTVKPLLSMVEAHLATKNPTSSAAEISKLARAYMGDVSGEIIRASGMTVTPKPAEGASGGKQQRGETDWSTWFGAEGAS